MKNNPCIPCRSKNTGIILNSTIWREQLYYYAILLRRVRKGEIMQDELREKTNSYITENGVKSKFISNRLGIDVAFFCRWKKGLKLLNDEHYQALNDYLHSKGY